MRSGSTSFSEMRHFQLWREAILLNILRVFAALGFLALCVGVYNAITFQRWSLVFAYTGVYLCISFLAFSQRISYEWRAAGTLFLVYILAVLGLSISGLSGDGRVFLLYFVLLTFILFDLKVSLFALCLSAVTCLVFAYLLVGQWLIIPVHVQANSAHSASWLSGTVVLLILSFACVAPWSYLSNGFRQSLRESQEVRESAEKANRIKTEFLAKMSHELRTPLNAIIGYAELLEEEAEDLQLDAFSNDLKKIQDSGGYLLSLVSDILDMSKIESGRIRLNVTSFDVAPLLEEVAQRFQTMAKQKQNTILCTCPSEIGQITTDRMRLRQILSNLLHNATKFTTNGTINISASLVEQNEKEWFVFHIKDTGIGIPEIQQNQLFEAFQQQEKGCVGQQSGIGLGLTICQELSILMKGHIEVDSTVGEGSTFSVFLPHSIA